MAAFAASPMGSVIPGTVLCCLCGTSIAPNPAAMCANCIRSQVDITEGIQKQCTVLWCKECNRWLNVRLCRGPAAPRCGVATHLATVAPPASCSRPKPGSGRTWSPKNCSLFA